MARDMNHSLFHTFCTRFCENETNLKVIQSIMGHTKGSELVSELKVVSENVFEKSKASALTSEAFAGFIEKNDIDEFYITGADATACVKSTSYNLVKAGYKVHVISDCITSYDLKKLDERFVYYANKGCEVLTLEECMREREA